MKINDVPIDDDAEIPIITASEFVAQIASLCLIGQASELNIVYLLEKITATIKEAKNLGHAEGYLKVAIMEQNIQKVK